MLVLGSRGRGAVGSLLLGSVGVAVARHASCPVVVHRPAHRGVVRNGVLVAVEASPESRPVLEFAFHEAELAQLPLTVMHCYWDVQSYVTGAYPPGRTTFDLEGAHLQLSELMAGLGEKYPGVHVTKAFVHGTPEVRVPEASEHMDLVVVGSHHASWRKQLVLGSVSTAVLERAHAPVAVVPVSVEQPQA